MVAKSAADVSARMNKLANAVRKVQGAGVRAAAAEIQAGVRSTSPARMRNAGKNGAKLSTTVRVRDGLLPSATVKAVGPWPLIEFDTPQHLIGLGRATTGTRASNRRGRRMARVRVVNGVAQGGYLEAAGYQHGVRGPIVHPGTKGKHVFRKGAERGSPKAVTQLRKLNLGAVREAFR